MINVIILSTSRKFHLSCLDVAPRRCEKKERVFCSSASLHKEEEEDERTKKKERKKVLSFQQMYKFDHFLSEIRLTQVRLGQVTGDAG